MSPAAGVESRIADRLAEPFERDFARSAEILEPPPAGWTTYIADFVAGKP